MDNPLYLLKENKTKKQQIQDKLVSQNNSKVKLRKICYEEEFHLRIKVIRRDRLD